MIRKGSTTTEPEYVCYTVSSKKCILSYHNRMQK